MILIIFIQLILLILLIAINVILFYSIIKGAPFAPTDPDVVSKMVEMADVKPGDKAVDVGSGDGRLVIALAEAGAEAHGYEINPLLVWWSRHKIRKSGLQDKAFIHGKSFWHQDFSSYDAITVFGMSHIMKKLSDKLRSELPPGARVISNTFSLPDWPRRQKIDRMYLYLK